MGRDGGQEAADSNDYVVTIPDERLSIVRFRQDGMPGIGAINAALVGFEPRVVFRWHLSIRVELEDLIENGMPSQSERDIVDPFGDSLDTLLKGSPTKPNALFLARITWNASRELIYRVYDPEEANHLLQHVIASQDYPREFDFRMDDDPEWKLAAWHLSME